MNGVCGNAGHTVRLARKVRTSAAPTVRIARRGVGVAIAACLGGPGTGRDSLAREWGKVAFNPDAIYYTSVSQGNKCDVFINISSRTRRVFLGLTPQNTNLGRRNTEKTT